MIQLYQTLDLRPIGIPQTLRLSQYDSDFEIIFELTNFDGTWILDTSTTAEVQGTKTDGHGYSADAVFDDQLKTVTIAGDVQMTAAAGRNTFEVVLFHDGDRLGSKNFILDVERAALDAETTQSDSQIKNFTEMAEAAEDAAETATAAAEEAVEAAASVSGITAEVENIRVGEDGTTYASAGDAVRAQIRDVNADVCALDDAVVLGIELDPVIKFVQGSISSSTGADIAPDSTHIRTGEYIASGTYLIQPNGQKVYIYFYNAADKSFNSLDGKYWGRTTEFTITIPPTYVWRLMTKKADDSDITPSSNVCAILLPTLLQKLNQNVNNTDINNYFVFESGGITTGGIIFEDETARNDRSRLTTAMQNVNTVSVKQNSTTSKNAYCFCYDLNGQYLGYSAKGFTTVPAVFEPKTINAATKFVRIVTNIPAEDVPSYDVKIEAVQNIAENANDSVENSVYVRRDVPGLEPYAIGTINQIARMGWKTQLTATPPQQSLPSYGLAYKNGCRIMLCDVRLTSDGKWVCWHDDDLSSSQISHTDGSALTAVEKSQKIADLTLEQIDAYDFGIHKGSAYAGTKILRVKDFLVWCSVHNCFAFLEVKIALTSAQITELAAMVKRYKIDGRVFVADTYINLSYNFNDWCAALPDAKIVIMGAISAIDTALSIATSIKALGVECVMSYTDPTQLTDTLIDQIANTGAKLWYTEIASESEMNTFWNAGYCSIYAYISSSFVKIYDWIYRKIES